MERAFSNYIGFQPTQQPWAVVLVKKSVDKLNSHDYNESRKVIRLINYLYGGD